MSLFLGKDELALTLKTVPYGNKINVNGFLGIKVGIYQANTEIASQEISGDVLDGQYINLGDFEGDQYYTIRTFQNGEEKFSTTVWKYPNVRGFEIQILKSTVISRNMFIAF